MRKYAVFEKKIQYALDNDYTVPLRWAFQGARSLYLAMEFSEYGDLERFFEHQDTYSERALEVVIAQTILGLEYIHACKVVYCDPKLNNLHF